MTATGFPDLLTTLPHPVGAEGSKEAALKAYLASGDAYMARGEFHLAVVEYGRSLNCVEVPEPGGESNPDAGRRPYLSVGDRNPEAAERRYEAANALHWFFKSGGDPDRPDLGMPDWVREVVRRTRLPSGYLVTAGGEHVLATFPATEEGRRHAAAFADRLAHDPDLRFWYDENYLAESDEFDAVVYRYDGTRAEEVHRAAALDEEGKPLGETLAS